MSTHSVNMIAGTADETNDSSQLASQAIFGLTEDEFNPVNASFVHKLFMLLQSSDFEQYLSWTKEGDCFVIINATDFSKNVLPKLFRHSNFASFVRQLNIYGFRKICDSRRSSFLGNKDAWGFSHPNFKRGRKDLLKEIKRQVGTKTKTDKDKDVELAAKDDPKYFWKESVSVGKPTMESEEIMQLRKENEELNDKVKQINQFLSSEVWRELSTLGTAVRAHHQTLQNITKCLGYLMTDENAPQMDFNLELNRSELKRRRTTEQDVPTDRDGAKNRLRVTHIDDPYSAHMPQAKPIAPLVPPSFSMVPERRPIGNETDSLRLSSLINSSSPSSAMPLPSFPQVALSTPFDTTTLLNRPSPKVLFPTSQSNTFSTVLNTEEDRQQSLSSR